MPTVSKLVNAFISDASPSDRLFSEALWAVYRFKRKHGGLWVGGTVSVSDTGVAFSPNRLNKAVHERLEPVNVLAGDMRAVRREFGWITGIVVIEHTQGEFRFRCYGARKLAATIAAICNVPSTTRA